MRLRERRRCEALIVVETQEAQARRGAFFDAPEGGSRQAIPVGSAGVNATLLGVCTNVPAGS